MIGRLQGKLIIKQPPELLIDVQGVGYEVDVPMSTFYALPDIGEMVTLHIHFAVREDAQNLYGFFTESERQLFRTLIKISGVGARLALAILSGMSVEAFGQCIFDKDIAALQRLPGVGKKTAERLLVELADKLDKIPTDDTSQAPIERVVNHSDNAANEAVSALVALGYKPVEAHRMVKVVNISENLSSEALIREALRTTLKTN